MAATRLDQDWDSLVKIRVDGEISASLGIEGERTAFLRRLHAASGGSMPRAARERVWNRLAVSADQGDRIPTNVEQSQYPRRSPSVGHVPLSTPIDRGGIPWAHVPRRMLSALLLILLLGGWAAIRVALPPGEPVARPPTRGASDDRAALGAVGAPTGAALAIVSEIAVRRVTLSPRAEWRIPAGSSIRASHNLLSGLLYLPTPDQGSARRIEPRGTDRGGTWPISDFDIDASAADVVIQNPGSVPAVMLQYVAGAAFPEPSNRGVVIETLYRQALDPPWRGKGALRTSSRWESGETTIIVGTSAGSVTLMVVASGAVEVTFSSPMLATPEAGSATTVLDAGEGRTMTGTGPLTLRTVSDGPALIAQFSIDPIP